MKTREGWGQDKRGHVGDPPSCHPDRPFFAKDRCRQCYMAAKAREYRAAHPERVAERARKVHAKALRDGPGRVPVHGMTDTPTWRSWAAMLARTTNRKHKAWANYGGRGIVVCERWQGAAHFSGGDGFANFLADMGERPADRTLDRIANNGNYEPGNCRWATQSEQALNRRH